MLTVLRQARYLVLLALGAALAVACTAAGVWQVHRYSTKHDENSLLRHNDEAPVVPAADLLAPGRPFDPGERFRKVTATGRYDVGGDLFVRQRQVDDQGVYLVLTPLRTDAGPTLFVVRGYTPLRGDATHTPSVPPPPSGEVAVTVRMYPSEQPSAERGLPARQVQRIDVPALGRRVGGATYGGYGELVSQRPAQHGLAGLPAPDLSNPAGGAFEGQHLAYVVQWFLFAALAIAAAPLLAWMEGRRGPELREPGHEGQDRPVGAAPTPTA